MTETLDNKLSLLHSIKKVQDQLEKTNVTMDKESTDFQSIIQSIDDKHNIEFIQLNLTDIEDLFAHFINNNMYSQAIHYANIIEVNIKKYFEQDDPIECKSFEVMIHSFILHYLQVPIEYCFSSYVILWLRSFRSFPSISWTTQIQKIALNQYPLCSTPFTP